MGEDKEDNARSTLVYVRTGRIWSWQLLGSIK